MSEHGHQVQRRGGDARHRLGQSGASGIEKFIDPIYKWLAWGGALCARALMVTMIYSAIGRYLGSPLERLRRTSSR